jgi:hypothetical protein
VVVPPPASVSSTTTTSYGSPGQVTSETISSGPIGTTTYKQKTYTYEENNE